MNRKLKRRMKSYNNQIRLQQDHLLVKTVYPQLRVVRILQGQFNNQQLKITKVVNSNSELNMEVIRRNKITIPAE